MIVRLPLLYHSVNSLNISATIVERIALCLHSLHKKEQNNPSLHLACKFTPVACTNEEPVNEDDLSLILLHQHIDTRTTFHSSFNQLQGTSSFVTWSSSDSSISFYECAFMTLTSKELWMHIKNTVDGRSLCMNKIQK